MSAANAPLASGGAVSQDGYVLAAAGPTLVQHSSALGPVPSASHTSLPHFIPTAKLTQELLSCQNVCDSRSQVN